MLFKLDKNISRPVVVLDKYKDCLALLDTGAEVPVWTDSENLLRYVYKARLVKAQEKFYGFGGATYGNLYRIPQFILGTLVYPDLPIIAVNDSRVPFSMILSASMFSRLTYEINDRDKYLRITVPEGESTVRHLEIKDSNGRLHILCNH